MATPEPSSDTSANAPRYGISKRTLVFGAVLWFLLACLPLLIVKVSKVTGGVSLNESERDLFGSISDGVAVCNAFFAALGLYFVAETLRLQLDAQKEQAQTAEDHEKWQQESLSLQQALTISANSTARTAALTAIYQHYHEIRLRDIALGKQKSVASALAWGKQMWAVRHLHNQVDGISNQSYFQTQHLEQLARELREIAAAISSNTVAVVGDISAFSMRVARLARLVADLFSEDLHQFKSIGAEMQRLYVHLWDADEVLAVPVSPNDTFNAKSSLSSETIEWIKVLQAMCTSIIEGAKVG